MDMNEVLWKTRQRNREFENLREQIESLWQDEAAKVINSRYLNPHGESATNTVALLTQQKEKLDTTDSLCAQALGAVKNADEYSARVNEKLTHAEEERRSAESSAEQAVRYRLEAGGKFPQIDQLVQQANTACKNSEDK